MAPRTNEGSPHTNNGKCDKTSTAHLEKMSEYDQLFKIVIRRFIRGFSAGLGVHAGYALIKAILRGSLTDGILKVCRAACSKSSIQTGTFLGLFSSLYHLALRYIKKYREIEDEWNYLISGAIAGLSIVSLGKASRQTITFFTLSRAIGAGIPALVARGDLPNIPYTDLAVFSVSTGYILYSAIYRPDSLSPGYYRSLMKWSRDYSDAIVTKVFRAQGQCFLTCQEAGVHTGSCIKHNMLDVRKGFPDAAKIYLPIHLLPILLYKRKALMNSPSTVIKSFIKNMVLSTSFLVTMTTVAKLTLCIFRHAHHQPPPMPGIIPLIAGTIGGWLGILWERKSRQRELALFNIFQVLSISCNAFRKSPSGSKQGFGIILGFTIMFSMAIMVIIHAYETKPESLNSVTKAGLKFLIGARDIDKKMLKNSNVDDKKTKVISCQ